MTNRLKLVLSLFVIVVFGCTTDNDTAPIANLTNEFAINDATTYLTPNGYLEEYIYEGEVTWYAIKFIDGKFFPISNPEEPPCPYVEDLNHGVSIWLRLDHDKKLESGVYNYTSSENDLGIIDNSEVFYGFRFSDTCFGTSETILKITDGTLMINQEPQGYMITYTLTSESGIKIEGTYFGTLTQRTIPEW